MAVPLSLSLDKFVLPNLHAFFYIANDLRLEHTHRI
jgi:hypothetical protein